MTNSNCIVNAFESDTEFPVPGILIQCGSIPDPMRTGIRDSTTARSFELGINSNCIVNVFKLLPIRIVLNAIVTGIDHT